MGGPPNTFTGATQPIPVRGDGSAQAGLPDANTGRDTRGVVNKHIQLCAVSLLTLCAYELDIRNNITIDLSAYPLKINVDTSLNDLQNKKQDNLLFTTPLLKDRVAGYRRWILNC